jgi:hypothetical protein
MAGSNSVQTVGDFTAVFSHPLIAPNGSQGAQQVLKGFKLDDTFFTSSQLIENSKVIALVNGDTVTLTNAVKAGRLTVNALRVGDTVESGDIIWIATLLQGAADAVGGVLTLSFGFNGAQETITFYTVTLVSCPPIILAGNDLPPYPVVWNYSRYTRG